MDFSDNFNKYKIDFLGSLTERADAIEGSFLGLEKGWSELQFSEAMREIHAIKGEASILGLPQISTICHLQEDKLQQIFSQLPKAADSSALLPFVDTLREIATILDKVQTIDEAHQELDPIKIKILEAEKNHTAHRVLYTDTSKTTKMMLQQVFSNQKIKVTHAADGYLALGRILNEPFDVVVIGQNAKGLTAKALIAAVRATELTLQPSFIVLGTDLKEPLEDPLDQTSFVQRNVKMSNHFAEILTKLLQEV